MVKFLADAFAVVILFRITHSFVFIVVNVVQLSLQAQATRFETTQLRTRLIHGMCQIISAPKLHIDHRRTGTGVVRAVQAQCHRIFDAAIGLQALLATSYITTCIDCDSGLAADANSLIERRHRLTAQAIFHADIQPIGTLTIFRRHRRASNDDDTQETQSQ